MDKDKLLKAKQEIDEILGKGGLAELEKISEALKTKQFIGFDIKLPVEELRKILSDELAKNKITIPDNTELLKSICEKLDKKGTGKVEVINFPEQKEFPKVEIPKEIEIKQPKWYSPFVFPLEKIIKGFEDALGRVILKAVKGVFDANLDKYTTIANPLAVRLVTPARERFYMAGGGYGGGGGGGTSDLVQKATKLTEEIVTLTLANTQYTYVLPANTKALSFRIRSGSYDLRYGYSALAGGNYRTLAAGASYNRENLDLTGATLYLNCPDAAGEIVEIEIWT